MGNNRIVWWVMGLLLLGVVMFVGYWYYKNYESEQRQERMVEANRAMYSLDPPPEFAHEFNPANTIGVYRVEQLEKESGVVELSYIWPKGRSSERVRTKINCSAWDYKMFEIGAKVPKYVTRAA